MKFPNGSMRFKNKPINILKMITPKKWSVKKTDKITEQQAVERAMVKLETFESNLKADHTETHFVFRKIRG